MKRNALYRYKKKVRKMMREFNRNFYDDKKFLGRFVISMKGFASSKYEDNSGWDVWFLFAIRDIQTNEVREMLLDSYCGNGKYAASNEHALRFLTSKMWSNINNFICDVSNRDGIMKRDYIPVDYRHR